LYGVNVTQADVADCKTKVVSLCVTCLAYCEPPIYDDKHVVLINVCTSFHLNVAAVSEVSSFELHAFERHLFARSKLNQSETVYTLFFMQVASPDRRSVYCYLSRISRHHHCPSDKQGTLTTDVR
jgi:hypothetical protein